MIYKKAHVANDTRMKYVGKRNVKRGNVKKYPRKSSKGGERIKAELKSQKSFAGIGLGAEVIVPSEVTAGISMELGEEGKKEDKGVEELRGEIKVMKEALKGVEEAMRRNIQKN